MLMSTMEKPLTEILVEGHFPCIPLPRAKAVNVDPAEVVNEISRLFKQHSTPVIPRIVHSKGFQTLPDLTWIRMSLDKEWLAGSSPFHLI
jgi:hypothetical protein